MEQNSREEAYRIYVTKSLQLIPQNGFLSTSYIDFLNPKKVDERNGDEIVADTMKLAGLKFED